MKRDLSLMIKPSSSKCNLKCKYCFYHSIANARDVKDYGFMEEDDLKKIIEKADEYCKGGQCVFGFQGGEPMLIGIQYYEKLIQYIKETKYKTKFTFHLQTNGTLINDKWAKFFKDNNFLIGVSLDGIKDIHNLNRVDYLNKDTFNTVMKGISYLKKYEVDFNILIVVTSMMCKKIEATYNFFKKNNFKFLQFIPCLDPLEENNTKNNYSLKPKDYEKFLEKLFDLWYTDMIKGEKISIRFFDNIVGLFLGYDYESCDMKGICSCQHVIESDGSMYPCDFYTYEKYSIGNIFNETFDTIHEKETTINFVKESLNLNEKCYTCKFRNICRGGCKRQRDMNNNNYNILCDAYYQFYSKTIARFQEIAKLYM